MTGISAVAVYDYLSAGQAGVAVRSAYDEPAGRINIIFGLLVQQLGRNYRPDHIFDHVLSYLLLGHIRIVLG